MNDKEALDNIESAIATIEIELAYIKAALDHLKKGERTMKCEGYPAYDNCAECELVSLSCHPKHNTKRMKKCKHLIILWHETSVFRFAQFTTPKEVYKCKSCDRMFTLQELDRFYDIERKEREP